VVTAPPHLCVEILSPEDRTSDTLEKAGEYLAWGAGWVWVIDPFTRTGQIHTRNGVSRVEDGVFSTDLFEIDLSAAEL
jgi:Uma2 family endonuclease